MFQNHKPHRRLQLFFAGATATLRLVTVCQDRYSDLRDDPNGIRRLLEVDAEDYAGQVLAQKEEKDWIVPENAVCSDPQLVRTFLSHLTESASTKNALPKVVACFDSSIRHDPDVVMDMLRVVAGNQNDLVSYESGLKWLLDACCVSSLAT